MPLVQAVTLGLLALILAPGWLFYFDVTPKLCVLLAGAAVCAVLWRGERASRGFTAVTAASAASLAISAAFSNSPALSVFGSTWRRFGLTAQLAALLLAWMVAASDRRSRISVLRAVAWSSGLAALYGIAQYFGWDPLLPRAAYHIGEGIWTIVRPPGTLGYVSYFATWLLMGGFLSLGLAGIEDRKSYRAVAFVAAALSFTAMSLTGTRAALLGMAVGIAAAAARSGFRIPRRAWAAAAAVAAVAALFYFSPGGWMLRSRSRWFAEDPGGGARPLLWRDSLRMGAARPLAGFGPEVFTAAFPHYESRELARAYPEFSHESPHNIFLDALVSQGLPGLACLGALCAIGILAAWRAKERWTLAALAAGIVAQQFTVFTIPTAALFYVVAALPQTPREGRLAPWARAALWAVAAVLLFCAVRYAAADLFLERTNRALAARDLHRAGEEYASYQRFRLPGAAADLWYSRALLALPAILPAGQAALAAVRGPEDPFDAWYNLAQIYAAGNSAAEAERCLRNAAAAHPVWFKPHWTLAQLLRLEGRIPEAAAEAALAADLDGGKHPEVARTAAEIGPLQK
jgi:O-antigen ligase